MHEHVRLLWIAVCLILIETCRALETHIHPKELHHYMSKRDLSRYFGVDTHDEVPEYEVIHPVQVNAQGEYMTHHLKGAFRRSTDAVGEDFSKIHYRMKAFGEDLHLTLKKNHALMAPNFKSSILGKNGKMLRSRKIRNCHYHGRTKQHERSKVAISNCEGLAGLIKTNQSSYFIEPIPRHLKGKLKPNGRKQPHLIFKHHGYYKTHRVQHGHGFIEQQRVVNFCGTKDNTSIKIDQSFHDEAGSKRTLPNVNSVPTNAKTGGTPKIIEDYLVIDQKMVNFHGEDAVEQFAMSAVNIAAKVLADSTIGGFPVKFTLVKMSVLMAPQDGLYIGHNAGRALGSVGEWAAKQNNQDDNHPEHFDHVTLFTRYNICADKDVPCDTLGLAPVSGMCNFPSSATINQDNGLLIGLTLAHETGHNLGMNHDHIGGCPDKENVMSTSASGKSSAFEWSACSRKFFDIFLQLDQSKCLNDEPQKRIKDLSKLEKAGVLYDADTQCANTFGQGSTFCGPSDYYLGQICYKLWCKMPNNPRMCSTVFEPAAEGTACGKKKWCIRGVCVEKGDEPPAAIDGGWSKWSVDYSKCTRTCGGGIQKRTRACNSPQPQNGGKDCEGEATEYKVCKAQPCPPNSVDFREVQCKAKDEKQYGEKKYKWMYHPSDLKFSCEIGCFQVENKNAGFDLGPAWDGTDCNSTTISKGKCIDAKCREVGCDGIIDSSAKVDRCGVCNGDGNSCVGTGISAMAEHRDGIPANKQFTWVTVASNCSASCAGGIAVNKSECRRVDDNSLVGESFCDAGERPPKKEMACNLQPCPPTWRADNWDDCSRTCNGGIRRRNVKCVQLIKAETEEDVDEALCVTSGIQKPMDLEKCNTFACEAEWLAKTFGQCSTACGAGVKKRTVVCVKASNSGVNLEVPVSQCFGQVKPFDTEKCNEDNPCPGEDGCGGKFVDVRGMLNSPGFPNDYPNDQQCVYSITGQPNSRIKVSFNSFKIDSADAAEGEEQCKGDRLEIYDGSCLATANAAVTKYCGGTKPDPYLSKTKDLCIKFFSDSAVSARGFSANYLSCAGKCDGTDSSVPLSVPLAVGSQTGAQPNIPPSVPLTVGSQTGAQPKAPLRDSEPLEMTKTADSFVGQTSVGGSSSEQYGRSQSALEDNTSLTGPSVESGAVSSAYGDDAMGSSRAGAEQSSTTPSTETAAEAKALGLDETYGMPTGKGEAAVRFSTDEENYPTPSSDSAGNGKKLGLYENYGTSSRKGAGNPISSGVNVFGSPSESLSPHSMNLNGGIATSKFRSSTGSSHGVLVGDSRRLESDKMGPSLDQPDSQTQQNLIRTPVKTDDSSLRQKTSRPESYNDNDNYDDNDDDDDNDGTEHHDDNVDGKDDMNNDENDDDDDDDTNSDSDNKDDSDDEMMEDDKEDKDTPSDVSKRVKGMVLVLKKDKPAKPFGKRNGIKRNSRKIH